MGDENPTTRAARSALTPRRLPDSTPKDALGAATTAANPARPPTSPKAIAIRRVTGTPASPAASTSDSIARRPRPSFERRRIKPARTCEGKADGDDEEGANLDRRAADGDEAVVADVVERQRIGEDVARPREEHVDRRADGVGDRHRRRDPTDDRAALEVGVDGKPVRPGARRDANRGPHRHGDEKPAGADARLRDRPRARRDEQSGEDGEADEVTEGEVDDPGQAIDENERDRDQAVDRAGREPRDQNLQEEAHSAPMPGEPLRRTAGDVHGGAPVFVAHIAERDDARPRLRTASVCHL